MPPLRDALQGLIDSAEVETLYSGPAESTPFARALRVLLLQLLEERRANRLAVQLMDEALIDSAALAALQPAELIDRASDDSAPLSPQHAQLLIRFARKVEKLGPSWPDLPVEALRGVFRGLPGIGPGTADSMLLAIDRPAFPVSRATYRILARHGWVDPDATYDDARETVEGAAGESAVRLAELKNLLDQIGKTHCRPGAPRCENCGLAPWLPQSGPLSLNGD